jgi:putative tryptophan/tyrosine transport system substrate-binding protein
MTRRCFIRLFGGAVLGLPLVARAQSAMPVIGFLHVASPSHLGPFVDALHKGLSEVGFTEGQNLSIEYRWAEGHYERLPDLAADLVNRQVAAILAMGGTEPARAAKSTTSTIPIVFITAADPVKAGLVAGVSLIAAALDEKNLSLLHELTKAPIVAGLVNPNYPGARTQADEIQNAATHLGVKAIPLSAVSDDEIEAAFASAVRQGAHAMLVGSDPFFNSRSGRFVAAAIRHAMPVIYPQREFVVGGGLISYGPDFSDGYRNAAIYIGKILKGEKPADLPVMQPTKFELVINLTTAKALGLAVPPTLLATADEVIE